MKILFIKMHSLLKHLGGILIVMSLVVLNSNDVMAQVEIQYPLSLGVQNARDGRCHVDIYIDEVSKQSYVAQEPNYDVVIKIPLNQVKNHKLKIQGSIKWGIPPNNAPACDFNKEIYLNEIIANEWIKYKSEMNDNGLYDCIELGARKIGRKINGDVSVSELFSRRDDYNIGRVRNACINVRALKLSSSFQCKVDSGEDSICEEWFTSSEYKDDRKLTYEQALKSAIDGFSINKKTWESEFAYKKRLENQEIKRQEAENHERWLKTPDGKKYLAEQAELERKRVAAEKREEQEQARRTKEELARLAIDFPYYALITCSFNNMDLGVYQCMFDRAGGTVLEIQNGSSYGMHKGNELVYGGPGKYAKGGYTINLRSNFALKIQNASKNYILGVEVRERSTNRIVFQKKANTYDVISVRN